MSATRRQGFTLIELLVVIAIIAILIALLVPAVQKVREAAARAQCQNNMKQLGLAMHMYHDSRGVLPPGFLYYGVTWEGRGDYSESTWVYRILPYVEQSALFKTLDYSIFYAGGNSFGQGTAATAAVRTTPLSVMTCPSDPNAAQLAAYSLMRGNYGVNTGVGEQLYATSPTGQGIAPGVFHLMSKTKLIAITDGTSQTAFIAELCNSPNGDLRGVLHYPEGPVYQHTNTPNSGIDEARTSCDNSDTFMPCTGTYGGYNTVKLQYAARSRHTGGVNLLLGDGSVRFVANSVNSGTWQALSTPRAVAGEAIVGDF